MIKFIRNDDGSYKETFKTNYVQFATACGGSARGTQRGFNKAMEMFGLADDIKAPSPHRKTVGMWKVVEIGVDLHAWLKKIDLFGVNTDGSRKGNKNIYEVILFGWNKKEHRDMVSAALG